MDNLQRPAGDDHAVRVKRQLARRAAVAASLMVALLVALVVFERKSSDNAADKPERAREGKTITRAEPSPPDPRPIELQSAGPVHPANAAGNQPSATPEARDAAPADVVLAQEAPEEGAEPAGPESARSRSARALPGKAPRLVVEQPAAAAPPTQNRKIDKASSPPAATPAPKSEVSAGTGAYIVQLGMFANTANAEQLRIRLTQNGIASYLETRVRLGPFGTRQAALAAQENLRKLGMETGVVITAKK